MPLLRLVAHIGSMEEVAVRAIFDELVAKQARRRLVKPRTADSLAVPSGPGTEEALFTYRLHLENGVVKEVLAVAAMAGLWTPARGVRGPIRA